MWLEEVNRNNEIQTNSFNINSASCINIYDYQLGRKRLAGKHSSMDIHGYHIRRHSRAVVHIRSNPRRCTSTGCSVCPHISPNRIYPGKHRTRQTEYPATGQQYAGKWSTSVIDCS